MNLHTLTEQSAAYIGMCYDTDDDTDLIDYINASPSPTTASLVYVGHWRIELRRCYPDDSGVRVTMLNVGDWLVRDAHGQLDERWRIIRKAAASRYDVRPAASNVDTMASIDVTTTDGQAWRSEALHIERLLTALKAVRGARSLNFEDPCRHDTSR